MLDAAAFTILLCELVGYPRNFLSRANIPAVTNKTIAASNEQSGVHAAKKTPEMRSQSNDCCPKQFDRNTVWR
jgi:hypothetical protein